VYINKEPPSGSTFPSTLEENLDVFLPTVATKRQSNPVDGDLLVPSQGIEVTE
jgi:hypothetical protein